jgi:hypothetical protein
MRIHGSIKCMTNKGSVFTLLILFVAVVLVAAFAFVKLKPAAQIVQETPVVSENERYQTLKWELATSSAPWGARDAHVLNVFQNKLWLIGGLKGDDAVAVNGTVEYWNAPHMSDIWNSDDGINWTLVTDKAPWKNRRSASAITFKDKMWVMGGWDQYNYKYTNDIWVTEDGVNWRVATSTTPRWEGREGQIVRELNGKLYYMGGVNFTKRITYNDVWSSEDGYTWTQVTGSAPWSPRYDHEVTAFNNALYLTGGYHINSHDTESEVWVSTDGLNWEKRIPEWSSRHGHIALPYKGRLWVIGGWHEIPEERVNHGVNDTWFTEDGIKWFKTQTDGPWTGREDHMGEIFRGKMWLSGGMDTDEKWSSEVYYSEVQ